MKRNIPTYKEISEAIDTLDKLLMDSDLVIYGYWLDYMKGEIRMYYTDVILEDILNDNKRK